MRATMPVRKVDTLSRRFEVGPEAQQLHVIAIAIAARADARRRWAGMASDHGIPPELVAPWPDPVPAPAPTSASDPAPFRHQHPPTRAGARAVC